MLSSYIQKENWMESLILLSPINIVSLATMILLNAGEMQDIASATLSTSTIRSAAMILHSQTTPKPLCNSAMTSALILLRTWT